LTDYRPSVIVVVFAVKPERGFAITMKLQSVRQPSARQPWEKPVLTVLMFRATANAPEDGADAQTEGVLICSQLGLNKRGNGFDRSFPNLCTS
jgi:hypothetical protein